MDIRLPPMLHVGLVVPDLAAAASDFERLWGVKTERVMDLTFSDALYRGSRASISARYGFVNTGASEIELIEPLSEPSPYTDFLDKNGGEGIHHLAFIVADIPPYIDHLGGDRLDMVLDAVLPSGGRVVYLDGVAHGTVVELIQPATATTT